MPCSPRDRPVAEPARCDPGTGLPGLDPARSGPPCWLPGPRCGGFESARVGTAGDARALRGLPDRARTSARLRSRDPGRPAGGRPHPRRPGPAALARASPHPLVRSTGLGRRAHRKEARADDRFCETADASVTVLTDLDGVLGAAPAPPTSSEVLCSNECGPKASGRGWRREEARPGEWAGDGVCDDGGGRSAPAPGAGEVMEECLVPGCPETR